MPGRFVLMTDPKKGLRYSGATDGQNDPKFIEDRNPDEWQRFRRDGDFIVCINSSFPKTAKGHYFAVADGKGHYFAAWDANLSCDKYKWEFYWDREEKRWTAKSVKHRTTLTLVASKKQAYPKEV